MNSNELLVSNVMHLSFLLSFIANYNVFFVYFLLSVECCCSISTAFEDKKNYRANMHLKNQQLLFNLSLLQLIQLKKNHKYRTKRFPTSWNIIFPYWEVHIFWTHWCCLPNTSVHRKHNIIVSLIIATVWSTLKISTSFTPLLLPTR